MEGYLTSMIDDFERYTEYFTAMVDQYSSRSGHPLHENISSMGRAHNRYIHALAVVQSAFVAFCYSDLASLLLASFMKDAVNNLDEVQRGFLVECASFFTPRFDGSHYTTAGAGAVKIMNERIDSLAEAHELCRGTVGMVLTQYSEVSDQQIDNSVIENLNVQHELFSLACNKFRDAINKRRQRDDFLECFERQKFPLPKVAVQANATEETSASPDKARPRDLESETRHCDEPDVSEERKTAVPPTLADHDLSTLEPEEAVENDTAAKEEAVNHKMAASQVP